MRIVYNQDVSDSGQPADVKAGEPQVARALVELALARLQHANERSGAGSGSAPDRPTSEAALTDLQATFPPGFVDGGNPTKHESMLRLTHTVANDHSSAFLAPVVIGQRLERLAVASSEPVDRDLDELKRAVHVLRAAGLVARVSASPERVVGGKRETELDGLSAYEEAFALWRDPNGQYQVAISGRGNLDAHSGPANLDEVLSFLMRVYADRPAPGR